MYLLKFKNPLRSAFARKEDGAAHIEAMIMVPMMFMVMITALTLLDFTRQHGAHQKAAFTIGDMVSRETLPLDADYLNGTQILLNTLTRTPQDSSLRVSIVRYDSANDIMKLDWSKVTGGYTALTNHNVRSWTEKLPHMVHNERMIIVETFARYEPPFNIGLGTQEIDHFVFTRPRYAPQVLWNDDPAPQFSG